MAFYIRKIDLGKWMLNSEVDDHRKLSADVITNCLKTKRNSLSLWKIDTMNQLNEALIAITSSMTHLDRIAIAFFEDKKLGDELNLQNSAGQTPFSEFREHHFDIVELDYESLGKFSKVVHEAVKDKNYEEMSKAKIKELLNKAVKDKKLNISEISEHIIKHLDIPNETIIK